MFEGIPFAYRLSRLQAAQRRTAKLHAIKIRQARRARVDSDELENLKQDEFLDASEFEGEIAQLQTRHWIDLAGRYHLPYPKPEDWAEPESPWYHRHLTREAVVRLRASIRQEQKERWERWGRWVPMITALVTALAGLLGVLLGVISVLKR